MTTLAKTPATTTATKSTDYKVINLNFKFKGKMVNLGGCFINDKSSKQAKQLFSDLEAELVAFDAITVEVRDVYNSVTEAETETTTPSDYE